jgi:hypothetical protein
MQLIKNETPYLGKIKLKFEKHPHYSGSESGILNKIHLNLGFTKLVSRMYPNKVMEGFSNVDPMKKLLIDNFTGGKIVKYEWWDVKNVKGETFTTTTEPKNKKDIVFHGVLEDSFVAPDGTYIGDLKQGWWYYKNQLKVYTKYPRGVAEQYQFDDTCCDTYLAGYYGYSHRGGCLFTIGDRLFDDAYHPNPNDYPAELWEVWTNKYIKALNKALKQNDDFWSKSIQEDGIAGFVPFKYRGKKTINTLEEAAHAAINMSNHLS